VTLHNEEAKITQVASISIVKSENKKDGTRTFEDIPLKMELKVKPEVANNGMVQMQVDILRQFAGAFRSDGTAGNHSRSATTKVMVKSGQTAVIGGIYQNDSAQMDNGVPWLKEIPIIGYLFRGTNFRKDKTELLLFLTPRVLSQAGNGVAATDNGAQAKDLDSSKGMDGSSGLELE
jgi:type IV pilus assembly protein PilQ